MARHSVTAAAERSDRAGVASATLPEPWFVAGMSRAGTQWVIKCLNEHSLVASFGETLFWGRAWVEPGPDGLYDAERLAKVRHNIRTLSNWAMLAGSGPGCFKRIADRADLDARLGAALDQIVPPVSPAHTFRTLAGVVAAAEGKRYAVEKTPHHVNWIDRILEALPDARFVVMVRDPYGFIRSYKHQGDRRPEDQRRAFRKLYHPAIAAMVWRRYIRAAQHALERAGDQVLLVRFEEIKRDPQAILARIQQFLGLPIEPIAGRVPPDNTSFPGGKKLDLAFADVFWMNLIGGREMRRNGFERRRAGFHPFGLAASVLGLPMWFMRNITTLNKRASSPLTYFVSWLRG